MIYCHILDISDNIIPKVAQKKKKLKYKDKDITRMMTYIILVYIIVFIAGIYVGINMMIKRQDILEKNKICKIKDVTSIL